MSRHPRWGIGLVAVGALALASCGGGGGDDLVPPSTKVGPVSFGGVEGT